MRVGDIYIDGIKVGVIDLSIEERDLAFEPQLASLQVGSEAPIITAPNANAPIRIPRGHGGGQLGPSGTPSESPSATKQTRHGGPTFRPGIGPGSRQRREKKQAREPEHETPETPASPAESKPSESTGKVGSSGASYLARQRAGFKKELEDPKTRELLGAVIHAENPGAGPAVAESIMNRTEYVNSIRRRQGKPPLTLRDMMLGHPDIAHGKSFYGPIRHGYMGSHLRAVREHAGVRAEMNRDIDAALAGSNSIRSNTDQGSRGDPNYYAGGVGVNIHGERFNDWGWGGSSRQWRQQRETEIEADQRDQHVSTTPDTQPDAGTGTQTTKDLPGGPTFRPGVGPGAVLPRERPGAPAAAAPAAPDMPAAQPDEKLVRDALHGTSLAGVDPNLREVMAGGIAAFKQANPGYDVVATSGFRHGGGFHSAGKAADFQIIGPHGAIPNRGWDETGMYHKLAQYALGYQMRHRPDLTGKFTWGGAFGTQRPSGGPPDLMHFDLGGWRGHYTQNRIETLKPLYPTDVASTAKPTAKVEIGTPSPVPETEKQ